MQIKNDVEHLVFREIQRRKASPRKGSRECWCAQCEADMQALALNHTPPRYVRQETFGHATSDGAGEIALKAVSLAYERVSQRPKHRPGVPDRSRSGAEVKNFALSIGAEMVVSAMAGAPCSCEQCRADTLAFALNRYPPKYGVSSSARPSYQENFTTFISHELGQLLAAAAKVVTANPKH